MNSKVNAPPIRFAHFSTGGTIDSQWYAETPHIITPMKHSLVPKAFESMGLKENIDFTHHAWHKPEDSKYFLTKEQFKIAKKENLLKNIETRRVDMDALIDEILAVDEQHVLITHGTDALVENAITIMNDPRVKDSGKVILFTAAMKPLANTYTGDNWFAEHDPLRVGYNFEDSDGYHNLKEAAALLQSNKLAPGVHMVGNLGTFVVSNEELYNTEKEFNCKPDQRFFYTTDSKSKWKNRVHPSTGHSMLNSPGEHWR